jgi:hypothetical protein
MSTRREEVAKIVHNLEQEIQAMRTMIEWPSVDEPQRELSFEYWANIGEHGIIAVRTTREEIDIFQSLNHYSDRVACVKFTIKCKVGDGL